MNTVRTAVRKGFTLVEILIVVVILGILAAIVIPQFSSASQAAQASSTVTQLQSLRSQLELYQLQHLGNYPSGAGTGIAPGEFWEQLNNFTDEAGTVYLTQAAADAARAAGASIFGPYLQKPISNPFISSVNRADEQISVSTDEPLSEDGVAAFGFLYNQTTGEIRANVPEDVADEVNFDTADGDVSTF